MLKRFGLLLLLIIALTPLAQGQGVPPAALDAALNAGTAQLGLSPAEWRWSTLPRTRSSTLGCPLLPQNESLPNEVTPYRFELTYADGIYIIIVSADGTIVQLCDNKFGIGDAPDPDATPPVVDTNEACVLTITGGGVTYAVPSFDELAMFGFAPGETYTPFGMTDNRLWYRIQQNAAVGWINVASVQESIGCTAFQPTINITPGGEPCFITPIGAFSNVRSRPTETSEIVDIMEENSVFQVLARSTDAIWNFTESGWVSSTVTNELGTCGGVLVDDSLVGTGSPDEEEQVPIDTTVAAILQDLACPPNFEGYLVPRLRIGSATARMDDGGFPNTLRSYPSTNDAIGQRLGVVQPSRTFDRVINGPVCNLGFVWWYIEIDGIQAWTAESNVEENSYYILPTAGNAASVAVVPTSTPLPPPPTALPTQAVQQIATAVVQPAVPANNNTPIVLATDTNPLRAVLFSNGDQFVYTIADVPGFGDATAGVIQAWNLETQTAGPRVAIPSGIIGAVHLGEGNQVVVLARNGTLTFYAGVDLTEGGTITNLVTRPDQAQFAYSPAGNQFTITECLDDSCSASSIQTYNDSGELVWEVQQANHVPQFVRYSRFGTLLSTTGLDGVRTWRSTGEVFSYYIMATDVQITNMNFSTEDGSQFFLVGCNLLDNTDVCQTGRIELVETGTASPLGQIPGIENAVTTSVMRNDFVRAAASLQNGTIRIFNSATGETLTTLTLPDPTVQITALAYSGDRTILAVATDNGQLLLYSVAIDS